MLKIEVEMDQTILVGPEALYRAVQFDALGPLLTGGGEPAAYRLSYT